MEFAHAAPNVFQSQTCPLMYPMSSPASFINTPPNEFVSAETNANQFSMGSIANQQSSAWQQTPLPNNGGLIWSHNVPNIMPWSNGNANNSCAPDNVFAFTQGSPNAFYAAPECIPQPGTLPAESYHFLNQQQSTAASVTQPSHLSNCSIPTSTSSAYALFQGSFNQNNKRQSSPSLEEDIDVDFDFESKRPVKKYISEDKVFEIFERWHIREGDHYIVEDAVEEELTAPTDDDFKHSVVIEMLDESEKDPVLELSPELKSAFQNRNPSITEKLLESEKDKLSKAVVLWQPNTILRSLISNEDEEADTGDDSANGASDTNSVKIEEVFTDEDEDMLNYEDDPIIEQISELEEDDAFDIME